MRHARPAFSLYIFLISIKLRIAVFLKTAKEFTLRTPRVSVLSSYTICFVTLTTVAEVVARAPPENRPGTDTLLRRVRST